MSANADLITVDTYVQQGKTSFSFIDQNVNTNYILSYLGGPEGLQ